MSIPVAAHLQNIPRSGIRDFFEVVQSMQDVISLGIGEPDFITPWHIREAAIYSLEKGRTGYTSNLGHARLRRSISEYVSKTTGQRYEPASEVLVAVGVSEAIDLALRAILNPGDEVLYHEPCYVSYSPSVALAHGVPRAVSTRSEDGFCLTADALEAAIGPRTRAVLLNFPTNPTGAVLSQARVAAIAEVCIRRDLTVLADDIYCELMYDDTRHTSIVSIPGMRERTVYLNGLSKAYAMTGFRVGYACGPAGVIDAMMKIHQYSILCAPTMVQDAAVEALDRGGDSVERMRREYELRRNYLVTSLNEIGMSCHRPQGAFYAFPQIPAGRLTSAEFSLRLLQEKKVAVVPGTAFGPSGEGHVRCSYATGLDQIKLAVSRITEFISEIGGAGPDSRVAPERV